MSKALSVSCWCAIDTSGVTLFCGAWWIQGQSFHRAMCWLALLVILSPKEVLLHVWFCFTSHRTIWQTILILIPLHIIRCQGDPELFSWGSCAVKSGTPVCDFLSIDHIWRATQATMKLIPIKTNQVLWSPFAAYHAFKSCAFQPRCFTRSSTLRLDVWTLLQFLGFLTFTWCFL